MTVPSRKIEYAARFRYAAQQGWWAALDLIFPPRCASCRRAGERLCATCCAEIDYIDAPLCERCGYPRQANAPESGECSQCRRIPFLGQGMRSLAMHDGSLRRALHTLKYRQNLALSAALAGLAVMRWPANFPAGAVLMPVPLSPERLRERGFNQAEALARQLAARLRRPVLAGALHRTRATRSQVGLTRRERLDNVSGAFAADPGLVGNLDIILIDDVCTTGATLGASAQALSLCGARVWAFTLARARSADADHLH